MAARVPGLKKIHCSISEDSGSVLDDLKSIELTLDKLKNTYLDCLKEFLTEKNENLAVKFHIVLTEDRTIKQK
jgi:hypothetical protein